MYQQLYLILTVILAVCEAEKCMHPPPSTQYSNSLYAGRWYEVGKYQTLGGSLFQQGTVCTIATYDPYDSTTGGGVIGYSSRKNEPTGKFVNATGILTQLEHPGHFSQQLNFGGFAGPEVDYNVIWLDEDSAIEYDCSEHLFGTLDYCVHFMSRTPVMDPMKLEELKQFVLDMQLNTHNLEYQVGDQNDCWNE